jgi:Leucine-rich repeat (LRR) protein
MSCDSKLRQLAKFLCYHEASGSVIHGGDPDKFCAKLKARGLPLDASAYKAFSDASAVLRYLFQVDDPQHPLWSHLKETATASIKVDDLIGLSEEMTAAVANLPLRSVVLDGVLYASEGGIPDVGRLFPCMTTLKCAVRGSVPQDNPIGRHPSLQILDISGSRFPARDNSLVELIPPRATELVAQKCNLGQIPKGINQKRLTRLDLSGNVLVYNVGQKKKWLPLPPTLETLDLSNNWIGTIPLAVSRLPKLKGLFLGRNNLGEYETEGWLLPKSLQSLDVQGNRLTRIPQFLGDTPPSLTELNVNANRFSVLDVTAPALSKLQKLGAARCTVYQMVGLGQLSELRWLDLSDNFLREFPEGLTALPLTELRLHGSFVRYLPDDVGHMQQLKSLFIGHNELTTLPASLANLENLTILDVRDNQLTMAGIPPELAASALTEVSLAENNLEGIPPCVATWGERGVAVDMVEQSPPLSPESIEDFRRHNPNAPVVFDRAEREALAVWSAYAFVGETHE